MTDPFGPTDSGGMGWIPMLPMDLGNKDSTPTPAAAAGVATTLDGATPASEVASGTDSTKTVAKAQTAGRE